MSRKKKLLIFFIVLTILFYGFNFAAALEIEYPTLSTGANITPTTPLPEYLKYVFDFGIFLGFFTIFLSLVIAGILYLLSPAIPNALEIARDRVSGSVTGLLILTTLYLVITTINPQLKFFKLDEPDVIPPPQNAEKQAGVYIYNQSNCSPPVPEQPHITSIPHLGALANRVNAVDIVQRPSENLYYVSILYDSPNFWGRCQYIHPKKSCVPVTFPSVSASIYQYNPYPNDEGVIFYRKSFYDSEGGLYKVPNSEIQTESGRLYTAKLSELKFNGVPENEQDCVKWDTKGSCTDRKPPSLAGENISSVEIKGDYVVLFMHFNELLDKKEGPWSFCQIFPTEDDVNREGPKQIKWESVRKLSTGRFPNYIAIIPVKRK